MKDYVKAPSDNVVEKVCKKAIHGKTDPAKPDEIVENVLGEKPKKDY